MRQTIPRLRPIITKRVHHIALRLLAPIRSLRNLPIKIHNLHITTPAKVNSDARSSQFAAHELPDVEAGVEGEAGGRDVDSGGGVADGYGVGGVVTRR
jgi:hypothetical protein